MDILDIFLDILLKPRQPLMGLFFRDQAESEKGCEGGGVAKAGGQQEEKG